MNTLQTPSRTASLNPFDIGAASEEQTAQTRRVTASFTPNDVVDEVEEFGCVDWYLYPSVRGRKEGFRPSRVLK